MPNESFAKLAQMRKCIDTPRPQAVYDECTPCRMDFARRATSACRVRGGSMLLSGKRDSACARGCLRLSLVAARFSGGIWFLTRAVQPNEASRGPIEATASWMAMRRIFKGR
jgi:hypothetical protein